MVLMYLIYGTPLTCRAMLLRSAVTGVEEAVVLSLAQSKDPKWFRDEENQARPRARASARARTHNHSV